jgi:hypothetical protein
MNDALPNYLDFETISSCNRFCPTCLRNSHPDRIELAPWFEKVYLDEDLIYQAIEQALELRFQGGVCLSHFNEPTMDERLPEIVRKVRAYDELKIVFFNTNGDFLTEEMASEFDEALDRIIVTLYMDEPKKSERAEWITGLFQKTEVQIITMSDHIPSHFSPAFEVVKLAEVARGKNCIEPDMRLIINHRRQYLLCCEDVIGNFDLGTFPETSIEDYWFNTNRPIAAGLRQPGGRAWHSYCMSCPKGAKWK